MEEGPRARGTFQLCLQMQKKKMDENGRGKKVWSKLDPDFLSVAVIVV
jgi:hypothetical protein